MMTSITEGNDVYNPKKCLITAAIDIGSSFSGYAYALKHKPDTVITNCDWGAKSGFQSTKTPSVVLIDINGGFKAFGYDAEQEYAKLCRRRKKDQFLLFRHFKMLLYNEKNLNRDTTIHSICGRSYSALHIFTVAIKFIKDHLLQAVERQNGSKPLDDQIQWVLTIPAIWTDQAKQFMRQAALQATLLASIESSQLMLALEPEVASVLCRELDVSEFANMNTSKGKISFQPGITYLIIDAGGGTVDITGHEIREDGNMIEIIPATGGDWGGNMVDRNFTMLLSSLFGEETTTKLRAKCPSDLMNIMITFEKKKKAVNITNNAKMEIPISANMSDKYLEISGKSIAESIRDASVTGVTYLEGSIVLNPELVIKFYNDVINDIKNKVRQILKDLHSSINYILLVGGFADSKFLYERLKSEFESQCLVLCPHSANLSVVKGAVMFAHKPYVIKARRMRKTYGTDYNDDFEEGTHDPDKKFTTGEGKTRCRGLFHAYVRVNELVDINVSRAIRSRPHTESQRQIHVNIYSSDLDKITYVDEPGVQKVGSLCIPVPPVTGVHWTKRVISHRIYFGQSEIKVDLEDTKAKDKKVVTTCIDFLAE